MERVRPGRRSGLQGPGDVFQQQVRRVRFGQDCRDPEAFEFGQVALLGVSASRSKVAHDVISRVCADRIRSHGYLEEPSSSLR